MTQEALIFVEYKKSVKDVFALKSYSGSWAHCADIGSHLKRFKALHACFVLSDSPCL